MQWMCTYQAHSTGHHSIKVGPPNRAYFMPAGSRNPLTMGTTVCQTQAMGKDKRWECSDEAPHTSHLIYIIFISRDTKDHQRSDCDHGCFCCSAIDKEQRWECSYQLIHATRTIDMMQYPGKQSAVVGKSKPAVEVSAPDIPGSDSLLKTKVNDLLMDWIYPDANICNIYMQTNIRESLITALTPCRWQVQVLSPPQLNQGWRQKVGVLRIASHINLFLQIWYTSSPAVQSYQTEWSVSSSANHGSFKCHGHSTRYALWPHQANYS